MVLHEDSICLVQRNRDNAYYVLYCAREERGECKRCESAKKDKRVINIQNCARYEMESTEAGGI